MTRDVNPFEPWRPAELGQPKREPQLSEKANGPQPLQVVLGIGLVLLGVIAFAQLPSSHAPRILIALLFIGLGAGAALSAARPWGWRVRLFCLGAGAGLAALAWWFVPTTEGLSLWSAQREADHLVTELEAMPACDTAAYLKASAEREQLIAQFPGYRQLLQQPADAWIERSVQKWKDDLGNVPEQDFAALETLRASYQPVLNETLEEAERDWFKRTYLHLKPGDFAAAGRTRASTRAKATWTGPVLIWEEGWAGRTADAALAEAELVMKNDPARASAQLQATARELASLGDYSTAQRKLWQVRQRAVQSRLEAARRQVQKLLATDDYQAAADLAKRLEEDCGREAQAVELAADLKRFQESCAFLAELSSRAKQPVPK
jgi:hypothetical protein